MVIEELVEIVSLVDPDAIAKELKRLGYHYCNEHGKFGKIGIVPIIAATVQSTENFIDEKRKYLYSGHICGPIEGHEEYEFLYVNVYSAKPSSDPLASNEAALQTEMSVWAKKKEKNKD